MISESLVRAFLKASRALVLGKVDTGLTGNGLKKLDFKAEDGIYTAIIQNPDKLSIPGKLAREGHQIVQIRDASQNVLLGNVDVTENRFNSYDAIPTVVDIDEIEDALGDEDIPEDEPVRITAARTSTPVNVEELRTIDRNAQRSASNPQPTRRHPNSVSGGRQERRRAS